MYSLSPPPKSLLLKIKSIIRKNILVDILINFCRRISIKDKSFSIISNNCWGGSVYQHFGLQYNSPFVGLFFFSKDYIKLLKNLPKYMKIELTFIGATESRYKKELMKNETYGKYPIGLLDDIEIHFLHYKNDDEARIKWERRKGRINYDNMIIKFSEKDLATEEDIKEFSNLEYRRKVALTAREYPFKCCIKLNGEEGKCINDEWNNFKRTVNIIKFINTI